MIDASKTVGQFVSYLRGNFSVTTTLTEDDPAEASYWCLRMFSLCDNVAATPESVSRLYGHKRLASFEGKLTY